MSFLVPLLLFLDGSGLVRQLALGVAMAALLIGLVRRSPIRPLHVILAMGIATAMEVVGSLFWGLYSYRHAPIPLYVPFGHGVFYSLAALSASVPAARSRERGIVISVVLAGSTYALASLSIFADWSGLVMWLLALAIIVLGPSPLMLAFCIVYTVALEWVGTVLGNWRWESVVPLLGLVSANPPSGVGACYGLLDLLTISACRLVMPYTGSALTSTSSPSTLTSYRGTLA